MTVRTKPKETKMNKRKVLKTFKKMPIICTERLTLRKLSVSDSTDMYEYSKKSIVTKYLLWTEHESESRSYNYLCGVSEWYKRGEYFDWAVTLTDSGKMIGTCGFTSFDFEHGRAEVGYVLNPDFWGQGIATEAVSAVIEFAFNELGANRVEAHFIEGNNASLRVMEKCGMTFEGYLKQYMLIKGEYKNIGFAAVTKDKFRSCGLYRKVTSGGFWSPLKNLVEKN